MKKNDALWIPWVVLTGLLAWYNIAFPLPASNDTPGFALQCLLVEQEGWRYLINNNTGFAHTGLLCLTTQITGNLLLAQRLIAALGCFAALLLLHRIAFDVLELPRHRMVVWGLALLSGSYFFMELALMPHLDILPICLVLLGIWKMKTLHTKNAFWISATVAASYWFRFHFIGFALLFPGAIFFTVEKARWKTTMLSLAAVIIAGLVPHILTIWAFGTFSISNQKAVLYEWVHNKHLNWSCDFQRSLMQTPYAELFTDFSLADSLRHFFADLGYLPEVSMPLLMLLTFFFLHVRRNQSGLWRVENETHAAVLIAGAYCALSVLPFVYLRGDTPRLLAAFFLPVFPLVLYLLKAHFRTFAGMALLIVIALGWRFATNYAGHLRNIKQLRETQQWVESVVPQEALRSEPSRIAATGELYLPYRKYLIAYPVLDCCWPCRYEPFFQYFDQLKIPIPASHALLNRVDYLIFTHSAQGSLQPPSDSEAWNRQAEKVAENDHVSIYRIIR